MNYVIYSGKNIEAIYSTPEEAIIAGVSNFLEVTNEELNKTQREWRDQELKKSDWIVPITDHPQRNTYITYRQALRDWPSTDNFPNIKPIL